MESGIIYLPNTCHNNLTVHFQIWSLLLTLKIYMSKSLKQFARVQDKVSRSSQFWTHLMQKVRRSHNMKSEIPSSGLKLIDKI